ncbi:MAG: tripartite tricarboxylate transporter substrate binding protein [Sphingomonadales bacterium]|nr:tripartite tricarboxylate transporter substrate binding protein [Sphingomonadales bacterium]
MRLFATAVVVIGLAAAASPRAVGQDSGRFPSKPVTLIVPWPAGGSTDITMRAMSEVAARHLGQPIIVDNRAGASGTLGPATMAANAKPDGYTICQIPITVFRVPMMQKTSWDATRDFTYIAHLTGYTFGIITRADSPFKTWNDVIAYAKENPGKVTYGTPGAATSLHIGMEQISAASGIKLTQVPFKGAAESSAAVLGGHTMLAAEGTAWKPLVEAGQLRVLMLWTDQRSPNWPDVPTLRDLGYPFAYDSPFGVAGPKGMHPAVVKKLHDAFKAAIEDKSVVDVLSRYDMPVRYMDSAGYTKFVDVVIAQERAVLDRIGLLKKD